ncbi:hypothetical protein A2U01_0111325, partial [Trifolium medium]|nr:hypothetical protein [Trifolium medium]
IPEHDLEGSGTWLPPQGPLRTGLPSHGPLWQCLQGYSFAI